MDDKQPRSFEMHVVEMLPRVSHACDVFRVVFEAPLTARNGSSPALCCPDHAVQRPECAGLVQEYMINSFSERCKCKRLM